MSYSQLAESVNALADSNETLRLAALDAVARSNEAVTDAQQAAQEAVATAASVANLNKVNQQFAFTFVAGQAQYDVGVISADNSITTAGLALWAEGALEYDFTINDAKKFTLGAGLIAALADGAQMRIIVNARFDDLISNFEDLQDGFTAEFATEQAGREVKYQDEKADRTGDYYTYLDGLALEMAVPYAAEIAVIRPTQTVTQSGVLYRPRATALPFETTEWTTDVTKFVVANDMALRQELLDPEGLGIAGFRQDGTGAFIRTGLEKLRDITTGADYSTAQLAANASFGRIFFVPDGADVTIDVPAQCPTLRNAIDAIDQWSIPSTSTVTINIADGHQFTNKAAVITHPNAERLTINGPVMSVNCQVTGLIGTTGSRGNYIATLAVSSVAGLAVGNWLSMRDIAGSSGPYKIFNGVYQVTAIGTGTVSVRIRLWTAAFPAMTLTGGKVYKFNAVIQSLNCDGLIIKSATPTINYLHFAGNMWDYWSEVDIFGTEKGTHGVYIGSNTIVDGAGTPGGENPYGISGGSLSGKFIGTADFDQQGFTTAGSSGLFGQYLVSSSCGRRGFYVGSGSAMEVKFSVSSTQYRDAVIADYNGAFNTSYFEGHGCRGAGAFANNGGKFIAPNSHFWFNATGMDIRAGCGGYFDAGSAKYNIGDGAHYEGGAGGSVSGTDLSENGIDGLSAFYSSGVRATNAIILNNGRDGINALGSAINRAGATITGNIRKNVTADGFSDVYDGTAFEPIGNHPAFYDLLMADLTKAHTGKFALNSIGDLLLTLDGIGRTVTKADGTIHPSVDGGPTIGRTQNRFLAAYAREYIIGTGSIKDFSGTGTPEGNKSAVVGSTYRREDGGVGSTLYYKASGTGNTGWVAIA